MIKYFNNYSQAVIANINLGGDNCNRAVLIGLLLGSVHHSKEIPTDWLKGLHQYTELEQLIKKVSQFILSSSGKINGLFYSDGTPDLSHLQFPLPLPSNDLKKTSLLFCETCKEGNCKI